MMQSMSMLVKTQDRKVAKTLKTNKDKDLKILEQKTKSEDNDKGLRSKITKHEGTSLQQDKDQNKDSRTKRQSNLNKSKENRPAFYEDDDEEYTIAITPVLPTEQPDNSLSMGDEHLNTILETESDKVIKSSVEDLVPIPSESEGIFDDTCDVPFCDNSPHLDVLNDHFEFFSDFNDDCTSSDDDSFENIDYVEASPLDSELVSLEEVKDDTLHEKLLNIYLLIAKIESLNDNPTLDCVLKFPFTFPIPVKDSDSFFKKSDTFLSYSDNSLLEFETFSDHTEEMNSGSTTTHADNSLPEYDSF
ncbi:hypothetical protein Tco_1083147 [Tanacetum coccineum]|uniref:Uncharacterized protein n=1 Tax=Tanacetum coccineum TaxID=301880 RepID=A0ABQ5I423_9ASTR